MRNTQLLEQVMQKILDNPQQHDQTWYFTKNECGTAACFAGWTCLLSGYEPRFVFDDNMASIAMKGHEHVTVHPTAEALLGLTFVESGHLFAGENTIPMLQLMVKDLVNGEPLMEPKHYKQITEDA